MEHTKDYTDIMNSENKQIRKEFDTTDFLKSIGLGDNTQDIDANKKDQQAIPQYVDADKPKFVQPEQRSYYVAGNVANNEIHTTAQRPNEIEYEADVVDDEKKKDNYFGLSKLKTNKVDIVKNALKYVASRVNPIKAVADDIGKLTGKSGEDVAMEGVRGFAGSTVDFASTLKRFFYQNYMYYKGYKDEQLDKIANLGNIVAGGDSFSEDIKQKYTDFYNRVDEQAKELIDKTERFLQEYGIAKTDKDGFIYDLIGGGASLMYAIGIAAITKSPAAAAEFFGAYQYQSLYEEGIEKGFSPIKARTIGVIGGAAEGALEMVGLHMLLETLVARKSFMKLLKAAATEFVQEASQQGAEELIAKISGMREEGLLTILQNVGYAGLIGALIGGGSAKISDIFHKQISDSATRELINKGVNSDYAKQMVNNMLNFAVSPQVADEINSMLKDEQSPVTYKNADPRETYKETGETIKKALDPAQKRGVELELIQANKKLTQERANVLLNSGKAKNSDEAYRMAEQQTAMYDVLAREAYNQEGIRPEDYYKRFHVNTQSGNIEIDERNVDEDNPFVDVSFDPIDFDPQARAEYEAAMDAQQEEIDKLQKEFTMSLKDHAKFFSEIGIEAIRRPTPDGAGRDRWGEYKDLSPRIKNYFFSDDATMSWDDAEKLLAESDSPIKDLFEYLAKADEKAKTYNQKEVFSKVLAKEKEDIKQKAVADGTFLKAPNGKDSNLPEQLWLIVRTKAFKNWFGDWLNLDKKKQLENAPVIKVKENVFVTNKDKSAREQAIEWAEKTKLNEKYNTIVGTVVIDKRSIKDSLGHGYSQKKLDTVASLKEGFKNAVYLESLKDFDNSDLINHYFVYPITYKGQRELVFCRARKDINLNRLYVHEVFTESELKNKADDTFQTAAYKAKHGGIALYRSILQNVLNVNEKSVSKVVDANGEPLVVYHGTDKANKKFSVFKGKVNYFTDSKQVAQTYSPTTIYEVFANIKNPIIVNTNKENWSGIDIDNITIDGIKDIKQFINHYGGATFKEKGATRTSVADITNAIYYAKEEGQIKNDGIVIKNIYDEGMYNDKAKTKLGNDYVVFDSKQVKSINNRGSFDSKNPDIYYQPAYNNNAAPLKLNETNVSQNTSLNGLKNKNNGNLELHIKAKAGDYRSAFELVKRVVKQDVINNLKQIAKEHKEAVVLPLLAREETGDNQLPNAYAKIIASETNLKLDRRIRQTNQTNHTNETRVERLSDLAEFEGEVINGQEYILVDDVMTTGSNINELRKYIERQGGKVIHVAVLATGRQGKKVFQPIVAETKKMLYNKFEGILNGNEKSETNITSQQQTDEQKVEQTGNRRDDGQLSQDRQIGQRVRSESDLYRLINLYLQSKNIANSIEELTEGQAKDVLSDDFIIDKKELAELENSQLFQDQEQPRGSITSFDRQYWIDLFSGSDKSTLLHEGSHGFLSEVLYFANGKNPSPKILTIKKQLDNWLGVPEDNGRYSKRQQELFAGASEVYFMEGKAPTPKLKTVFERFKKWLTDIYDAIKNDLPKINDDVRELFDTILSRSYDVPDSNIYAGKEKAIKEVIKNIQEGRASEVDGITIDDVYNLLNVAYTRKPSKPSKNLKQLLNDKNIYDFNELTKAGADTVLQILKDGGYVKEDATTEQALELARQALDGKLIYRLADQWRVAGDIDFARNLRILEKVIEFSQIDSVMEKILTLQEEGYRNVEQGDVEQVQDEYKRLMSADVKEAKKIVENIINRLHKKRFIDRAAQKQMIVDLNFSSTVEEIKESVLNVIEDLQDEIKLVKEQLRNPRKPVVRKDKTIPPGKNATEEEKNTYKKYMRKQINKLLKQALPRKQNQQKFSKFDVETQRFFTALEEYNKMTIEAAQEELYKRATSIIDDEGVGLSNYEKMKNMFLSYKANKINQNSVEFYKQLYDNLQEINVFGRNAKDIENTLKKEQIQQDINSLVVNIEDNKSKNKLATGVKKQYIKWLGNWWSTINAVAGKKQADKDSLERIEINIFNKNYETTENLKTKCADALGLKNVTDLDMTVNRYLNEEYTYEENDPRSNTSNAVKLNKMQLICCYIWMKNSTLRERIVRAFGNIQIMDMMDKLTIQDKKFGDELQQSVADMYDEVNTVYLKMYGLDMPQAENYFPSSVERIQGNMDLLKDNIGQVSSPGFIKARVQSNLPLMNFGNPVKIALDHIAKVNHFIYMQEKLADLNKVYKTTVVKRHITNAYGDRVYAYILQVLDNAKFTNVARTIDGISDIGDYLVNNYVLTKIAVKPSIMMKQLLSCINYAEDMSAVKWFEGFLKGIASPKKVIDFMMKNSKYCQSRFAKGGQSEALLKAMEGSNATFAKVKTFKGMLSWMTRVGDIGAIMFGGYPYVMDQMSKGVPLKTAVENFERATIRSQQASLPSTLSNFQYRGMNSWLYRAMFAFANTPNQYSRKIGDTMYMYFHGDINKKQFAKNLILYGVLNSFLYTSFTSLAILAGLVSGDWDDLKDDAIMSLFQTSNVLALPIISQAYNSFVSKVVTGDFLPDKEIPLLDDMVKIMRTATKDELEFKDWLTIVDEVASLVLGVPVKTLYNTFVGSTKDLLDGEYGKFAVKLYGATESRANKIFD